MAVLQSRALVSIGQAARLASVNPQTIRRYLESGLITGTRTPGLHRRIDLQSVAEAFGVNLPDDSAPEPTEGRVCLLMGRVSTKKQETRGDLKRQVEKRRAYAAEHHPDLPIKVIAEVGSGLRSDRPGFLKMVDLITASRVSVLVCTWKDRISRFGVNLIEHLCKVYGTTIVEIRDDDGNENRETCADLEMSRDILSIIGLFHNKMMGKRGAAKIKIVFPPGFRERVAQLAGSGLGRRDIAKVIVKEKWTCCNTSKLLGERSVRKVLADLGTSKPVIPQSVRTFLTKRCTLGVAKRARSADLYAAYLVHCGTTKLPALNQDKWIAFVKQAVGPTCRLENGRVSIAYGLTLKKTKPCKPQVRFVTFTRAALAHPTNFTSNHAATPQEKK
jgi:putative resolvase